MSQEFDPWKRRRAADPEETVELPEIGLTLTLRALDTLRTTEALDEAQHLIEAHVTGEEAKPLFAPDGEEYPLNELLIRDLCLMRAMQVGAPRGFIWWLGLALNCDQEYAALSAAAARVNAKKQKASLGNSSRGADSTTANSAPSSATTTATPS